MPYERDFAPLPAPEPRWRERLRQYWALVRGDRPIGWLLLLWPTWWGLWLAADGVHPTPAGYAVMAPLAQRAIEDALGRK